jgi:hypothetical protein
MTNTNTRQPQTGPQEPAGGLNLPKDVGVGAAAAYAIGTEWNTIAAVDALLLKRGIHDNPEPDVSCPVVTAEILTDPDVTKYSYVYASQLRWYNYVTRLMADIRAVILQVKNGMDDIETSKRGHFRQLNAGQDKPNRLDKSEMEDLIQQEPYYRDLKKQLQILEQQRIKVDAWAESLDRNLKTISRQIENRRTENNGGNREGNMPGAAIGAWQRGPGGKLR